jgi:hypothetical protein
MDRLRKLQTRIGNGVAWLRHGLVVFQFTASLTLIICTVFIYLQIQHGKNRPLGMNVEQVLYVFANADIQNHFEPLKQELMATGVVENVGLSDQFMLEMWSNGGGWKWQGKPDDTDPLVSMAFITDGLLPTLGMTMSEGRNFEAGDKDKNYIIINRAFAELIGEEGRPEGRLWRGDGTNEEDNHIIIGIVDDYVFNNPFGGKMKPVVLWMSDAENRLFIRLKSGDMQTSLQLVEDAVKRIDPNHPFEYRFMDEIFNRRFNSQRLVGKLAGLFALLAVFISCLGLFGLTAFSVEQRTKEIGIRKVLGASIRNILELLGNNFLLLIGIAFVIATPLAWWITHGWLQQYAYRISISWWIFVGSGILVALIAILTVGILALRAAMADPIKSISNSE